MLLQLEQLDLEGPKRLVLVDERGQPVALLFQLPDALVEHVRLGRKLRNRLEMRRISVLGLDTHSLLFGRRCRPVDPDYAREGLTATPAGSDAPAPARVRTSASLDGSDPCLAARGRPCDPLAGDGGSSRPSRSRGRRRTPTHRGRRLGRRVDGTAGSRRNVGRRCLHAEVDLDHLHAAPPPPPRALPYCRNHTGRDRPARPRAVDRRWRELLEDPWGARDLRERHDPLGRSRVRARRRPTRRHRVDAAASSARRRWLEL